MLRKIRKRQEVLIASSDERKIMTFSDKASVTRSELCVEHKAFCKAYGELSKVAHSLPSISFGVLFKIWILYSDTALSILWPPLDWLYGALSTYEPLVTLRLLVALSMFRVHSAWIFPLLQKLRDSSSTKMGQGRRRVLMYISFFVVCGVYTLSLFAFGVEIYSFTETSRIRLRYSRIAVVGSLTLSLLYNCVHGGSRVADIAQNMLTCHGKLPEGSAHDRVFKKVRSSCFDPLPVYYTLGAFDWFGVVCDIFIFCTNAMAWDSWRSTSTDGLNCQALAVDLILEPLVYHLWPIGLPHYRMRCASIVSSSMLKI